MCIEKNKQFVAFVAWVCNFEDEDLIEQIHILEFMIDCDLEKESVLIDMILDLYNALRDECVRRIEERINERE